MTADDDRGLAAERTEIAWGRTGLAIATCLAVVLRRVPSMSRGQLAAGVIGVALALGVLVFLSGVRPLRSVDRRPIAVSRDRLRHQAIVTSMVGVLCLAVMLPALV